MASTGSVAGRDLFDSMGMKYEEVYKDNYLKENIVSSAIRQLPNIGGTDDRPKVLDVGCGTGHPVSSMLAEKQLDVYAIDVCDKMVKLAKARVRGTFTTIDMIEYQPPHKFAGIFMIFSHLQLVYADFHEACFKYAQSLHPGGLLVIGQMPADKYVKEKSDYDESGTWVENYKAPFMGEPLPTFMMTAQGQVKFLQSMGLEIIEQTIGSYQPNHPDCTPEEQQYIIAKRPNAEPLRRPLPLPTQSESHDD